MKRWSILICFSVLFFGLITPTIADVAPRNPFRSPCPNGQKAYYCSYATRDYGVVISDECRVYKNNPNFISHSYEKAFDHSSSGNIITITSQYCGPSNLGLATLSPIVSSDLFWMQYARRLLFTLFLEILVVIFLKSFRNKKALFSFIFANIVSVLLLQLFVIVTPIASLLIVTAIGEILVVLFEFLVVLFISKQKWRNVLVPIVLANIISAVVGSIFYFRYLG